MLGSTFFLFFFLCFLTLVLGFAIGSLPIVDSVAPGVVGVVAPGAPVSAANAKALIEKTAATKVTNVFFIEFPHGSVKVVFKISTLHRYTAMNMPIGKINPI
jgi:hypothetical protein